MEKLKELNSEKTPLMTERSEDQNSLRKFIQSFRELLESPRDLFLLYLYELIVYSALTMINLSMSIYLTQVLGFSDMSTGLLIAGFGTSGIIAAICFGYFIDIYGIRKSLLFSNFFGFVTFILLIFIENTYVQITVFFTCLSIALSVNLPTAKYAVKNYTLETSRSLGYSIFYMALFTGAGLSGAVVDLILSLGGVNMETFKIIFIVGACEMFIATLISFRLREIDFQNYGDTVIELNQFEKTGLNHTKETLSLKSFWRFILLTALLVIVKAVYKHIFVTLPIFMFREIGEDAHFGYMLAIHKVIMILAIPACTLLIYHFDSYTLLTIGCVFSALAFIPLMLGGNYLNVILFITIVSIGEAIYAPRLIDYTLAVAPKGREGIFLAVAASPLILSIIIAGLMAGILLDTYCPEDGEREC